MPVHNKFFVKKNYHGSETQSHVLMPVWQVFYQVNHLSRSLGCQCILKHIQLLNFFPTVWNNMHNEIFPSQIWHAES